MEAGEGGGVQQAQKDSLFGINSAHIIIITRETC